MRLLKVVMASLICRMNIFSASRSLAIKLSFFCKLRISSFSRSSGMPALSIIKKRLMILFELCLSKLYASQQFFLNKRKFSVSFFSMLMVVVSLPPPVAFASSFAAA